MDPLDNSLVVFPLWLRRSVYIPVFAVAGVSSLARTRVVAGAVARALLRTVTQLSGLYPPRSFFSLEDPGIWFWDEALLRQ